MRLPPAFSRRQALLRALVGLTAGRLSLEGARPAHAAYTVVSTGSISELRPKLADVAKKLGDKTFEDEPYLFGEKAQLEDDDELPSDRFDIQSLEKNKAYAQQMSADVAAGMRSFYQSMRIGVPDMDKAVTFWTKGCGALVLDTKLVNGVNVTRIGFGPQSIRRDDGAKFALEMVEGPSTSFETGGVLQYVQLAIPIFRLSQVMKNGGDIQSAYGWTQLTAPGGLPLRVHIDESRRDPFEFVALRTSSLKSSVAHYESLGLRKVDEKSGRKVELSINKNTIFENSDAYEPDREVGSILMSYGDKKAETGVLLLPPLKGAKLITGSNGAAADPMPPVMSFVGAPALVDRPGPDGVLSVFTPIEEFEASLVKMA